MIQKRDREANWNRNYRAIHYGGFVTVRSAKILFPRQLKIHQKKRKTNKKEKKTKKEKGKQKKKNEIQFGVTVHGGR